MSSPEVAAARDAFVALMQITHRHAREARLMQRRHAEEEAALSKVVQETRTAALEVLFAETQDLFGAACLVTKGDLGILVSVPGEASCLLLLPAMEQGRMPVCAEIFSEEDRPGASRYPSLGFGASVEEAVLELRGVLGRHADMACGFVRKVYDLRDRSACVSEAR